MTLIRTRLVRGLISGLLHEAAVVVFSFAAMMVLVRLLSPEEYGQAAAAIGVLAFIGAFRGALFVEHALQHPKDTQPDWDSYFAVVGVVQVALCGATLAISFLCRSMETFAPLAPLLQVAAVGFLFEWPAQVAQVKLRRDLRFERLKLIASLSVSLRLSSAVVLAWLGLGAMALVISGNVLSAVPLAINFLFVDRWRPERGWWTMAAPALDIRPMLRFGGQQFAMGFVHSLRIAAESLVLTKFFGIATFGLLNRAQALYHSTIGRLGLVFVEMAYPLLPMERTDPGRYAQRASRFVEAALILAIPGAAFIAIEGTAVSRLLYGRTWAAADPFLAPAAIAAAALALVSAAGHVVKGVGRMRVAVTIETLAAVGGLGSLLMAMLVPNPAAYVWTLAATQIAAAVVAFSFASALLEADWRRKGLWPAIAATACGCVGSVGLRSWAPFDGWLSLLLSAATYAGLVALVLTVTARPLVLEVMRARKALFWPAPPAARSQAGA